METQYLGRAGAPEIDGSTPPKLDYRVNRSASKPGSVGYSIGLSPKCFLTMRSRSSPSSSSGSISSGYVK